MNRETLIEGISGGFGSPQYAREELRAEISAMMTGERVGVGHDPSRGAAYVEGWIQALEEDPREIRRAAADAQKISDFVLVRHRERVAARDPVAVAAVRTPGPTHTHELQRIQVSAPRLPVPERGFGPSR
jgi:antirestriction protein ArdC